MIWTVIRALIISCYSYFSGHRFFRVHSALVLGDSPLHPCGLWSTSCHTQDTVHTREEQGSTTHRRTQERGGHLGENSTETKCGLVRRESNQGRPHSQG